MITRASKLPKSLTVDAVISSPKTLHTHLLGRLDRLYATVIIPRALWR